MATSSVQQPLLATVVAVELGQARPELPGGSRVDEFAQLLVTSIAQSCSVQRQLRGESCDGLTIVMPPDAAVGSVLRRALGTARLFEDKYPGERVRMVVHHGVVFAAGDGKRDIYVGSAVRSAHSALQRLERENDTVCTSEFARFAREWPGSPLRFAPLTGRAGADGLSALSIDAVAQESREATVRPLQKDDAELQRFLVGRLAQDVGPFASVLVETARRTAGSVDTLLVELSHEVDDADERQRFLADARNYVSMRRG